MRQSPVQEPEETEKETSELGKLSLPTLLSLTKSPLAQLINNNQNKQSTSRPSPTLEANSSRESESKRSRTQLTNGQVNAMQATFDLYRSPSLAECEILGSGIGLARRVVQVNDLQWLRHRLELSIRDIRPSSPFHYWSYDFRFRTCSIEHASSMMEHSIST